MTVPAQAAAVWLLSVNLAAFALMGADKYRAKRNLWRIPEKTLFTVAFLGGTPGAILGMRLFHHKTRHRHFRYGLPVLLAVQLAATGCYLLY